jgi:hypothetical protein
MEEDLSILLEMEEMLKIEEEEEEKLMPESCPQCGVARSYYDTSDPAKCVRNELETDSDVLYDRVHMIAGGEQAIQIDPNKIG